MALTTIDSHGRVFLGALSGGMVATYEPLPTLISKALCFAPPTGMGVAIRRVDGRSRLLLNREDRRVIGRSVGDQVLVVVDEYRRLWIVDPVVVVDRWSAAVVDG